MPFIAGVLSVEREESDLRITDFCLWKKSKSDIDFWPRSLCKLFFYNIILPSRDVVMTFNTHTATASCVWTKLYEYDEKIKNMFEMIEVFYSSLKISNCVWSHIVFTSSGQVKGKVPRDFRLQVFCESVSPKPLSIPLEPFRNFFENSRRYSQL
jgi:hypothetical protein